MNTKTFTPGPWKVAHSLYWGTPHITDESGELFISSGIGPGVPHDPREASANATLIASAPELLAALEEMVIANHGLPANPADEPDPVCRRALELAVAALAKAKGTP